MLPDVRLSITDGGLGLVEPGSGGIHAKVGVCSLGTVNEIVSVSTDAMDNLPSLFGTGPLVNAILDSLLSGSKIIYAVRAAGDIAGTIGTITAAKTGTGDMTAIGNPLDAYAVNVQIVDTGRFNTATFKYSLDGGTTWVQKITVPTDGKYVIPGTGITLNFTESTEDALNSFKAGDAYAFVTTAPEASVNSVNAAIDALLNSAYEYEFIHVVGGSDEAVWAALDAKANLAFNSYRYIHFLAEAEGPASGQTVDDWVAALQASSESFASTRVSVCAARGIAPAVSQVERNLAGIYAGRVSSIKSNISPGKVADGPLPGINEIGPAGINDGHITALDEAGYITFRRYIGMSGVYVTNGRIMADPVSDYQYVELRRTMDKACRIVRNAALRYEHAEIDESGEEGIAAIESQLTQELLTGMGDEIAAGQVIIPRDQNITSTSKLAGKIRVQPTGTIRFIEIDMGLAILE
jgi:hypothetical protein